MTSACVVIVSDAEDIQGGAALNRIVLRFIHYEKLSELQFNEACSSYNHANSVHSCLVSLNFTANTLKLRYGPIFLYLGTPDHEYESRCKIF